MMRIGLLFGSRSVEHEISVTTASKAYEALQRLAALYETVPIYVNRSGAWLGGPAVTRLLGVEAEGRASTDPAARQRLQQEYKQQLLLLEKGAGQAGVESLLLPPDPTVRGLLGNPELSSWFKKSLRPALDVAFPTVHGTHGEDGTLQGLFELADLPYVGPGLAASAAGMDKVLSKQLFRGAGLPVLTATWFSRRRFLEDEAAVIADVESRLPYPVVVKPAVAGSSVGIGRAGDAASLRRAASAAVQFSTRVLVEPSLDERLEIQCSVLGNHALSVSECEELTAGAAIVSFEDKYLKRPEAAAADLAPSTIPARIPETLAAEIKALALDAFRALDARGIARVDFLVKRPALTPYVNEINTLPGSLCLRLWEKSGVPPTELVRRLITLALEAHAEKRATRFESQEGRGLVDKKHLMTPGK
ncbi:MAG: D-alanine--D-alanine ligase [candidate division NC10 bacterium]|nr:D-alanine--D-alanine ligase [candidate division NC10 bacterium]